MHTRDDFHANSPRSRSVELTEKDGLPGAQHEFPSRDDDDFRLTQKGSLDMGVGIPFPVQEGGIFRHHSVQLIENVRGDGRVGIFVDGYRRGGVGDEDAHQALGNFLPRYYFLYLSCYIYHLTPFTGGDGKAFHPDYLRDTVFFNTPSVFVIGSSEKRPEARASLYTS